MNAPAGLNRDATAGLIAAVLTALALTPRPSAAEEAVAPGSPDAPSSNQAGPPASDPDPVPVYWSREREGWFWYREPPPTARPTPRRETDRRPSPPTATAPIPPQPPQPPQHQPPELQALDALQQRLETSKRIAVMNPSDANLLAYLQLQRQVMDRSERFAQRWQRLVWRTPELDYSLTGRPTNAVAIGAYDRDQTERQARDVRALAARHGLLFLFRSDCPHCHRFAPILKRFEQTHGLTVLAISLDGKPIPGFPNAQPDNGIAARLDAQVVPALYLSEPRTRRIRPVGYGVMAESELLERLSALAHEDDAEDRTPPGGLP